MKIKTFCKKDTLNKHDPLCCLVSKDHIFHVDQSICFAFSVGSACLPSPFSRNPLICPVATSFADHAGKGKSFLLLRVVPWDRLQQPPKEI